MRRRAHGWIRHPRRCRRRDWLPPSGLSPAPLLSPRLDAAEPAGSVAPAPSPPQSPVTAATHPLCRYRSRHRLRHQWRGMRRGLRLGGEGGGGKSVIWRIEWIWERGEEGMGGQWQHGEPPVVAVAVTSGEAEREEGIRRGEDVERRRRG